MSEYIMSDISTFTAYALALIVSTQDPQATWKDTYPTTAAAFAKEAMMRPLFRGDDGVARTIASFASVSAFESHHDPRAKGDGKCLAYKEVCKEMAPRGEREDLRCKDVCVKRGPPRSFCLAQIHDSNFAYLGVTKETLLDDVDTCVHAMDTMLQASIKTCSAVFPSDQLEWFNQYATGGGECIASDTTTPAGIQAMKGRHRMKRGMWLFNNIKP